MPGAFTIDLKKNHKEVDRVIAVLRHRERTPDNHIDGFCASYLKLYRKHISCIVEAYACRCPPAPIEPEDERPFAKLV